MNEIAVYSCKISATIANPGGENAGHRAATQGSESRKATLEERGLLPGRPHFLWDWEVRDLPGKARSRRDCVTWWRLVGLRCAFGDPIFVYQIFHRDRSGVRIVELIRPLFCAATCQ
jgi:hypothetical protein